MRTVGGGAGRCVRAAAAAEPPDGGLVSVAEFRQHYAALRAKTRRQAAAQPARAGGSAVVPATAAPGGRLCDAVVPEPVAALFALVP